MARQAIARIQTTPWLVTLLREPQSQSVCHKTYLNRYTCRHSTQVPALCGRGYILGPFHSLNEMFHCFYMYIENVPALCKMTDRTRVRDTHGTRYPLGEGVSHVCRSVVRCFHDEGVRDRTTGQGHKGQLVGALRVGSLGGTPQSAVGWSRPATVRRRGVERPRR